MLEFETVNGKLYQLRMRDGDHFYRWYGDGQLHPILTGGFTDIQMAEKAMDLYLRQVDSKKKVKKGCTPLDELKVLSKAKDLKDFAERHSIEIPESFNIPSQIKKYLRTQLGE